MIRYKVMEGVVQLPAGMIISGLSKEQIEPRRNRMTEVEGEDGAFELDDILDFKKGEEFTTADEMPKIYWGRIGVLGGGEVHKGPGAVKAASKRAAKARSAKPETKAAKQ